MRSRLLFGLLALVVSLLITRGLVAQPGYTDAYYYFNAANRLVQGNGLTDPYLWTYVGAPETLPAPSHLYWMPFTSLVAAFGMWIFDAPGDYAVAQWPFALMLAGTAMTAFWLGGRIGGTQRHRWVAGLLALFSGFYVRFWGMTDTFAPFALVGSLALVMIGLGLESLRRLEQPHLRNRFYVLWFAAGVLAGFGHLTRADGLLLLLVAWMVILWPWDLLRHRVISLRLSALLVVTLGYLLVMGPWFVRNLDAVGTPLPLGGTDAIWYTEYNDHFRYPPGVGPDDLFADGPGLFFRSRWTAFTNNLGTFVAVEGLIIMAPLMLAGLWVRRQSPFLRGFWLYALGLHVAMTFVFPFPGYRGGLLHSASALVPWWAALGVAGLDDVVNWISRRRRTWRPRQAQQVFSVGLVLLALALSWNTATSNQVGQGTPDRYRILAAHLPADALIMSADPAEVYYYTGLGGVVTPSAAPELIPEIAARYGITHLMVETVGSGDTITLAVPDRLVFDPDNPPVFLTEIPFSPSGVRLYAIDSR